MSKKAIYRPKATTSETGTQTPVVVCPKEESGSPSSVQPKESVESQETQTESERVEDACVRVAQEVPTAHPVTPAFLGFWRKHGVRFVQNADLAATHSHPNCATERNFAEDLMFDMAYTSAKTSDSTLIEVGGNCVRSRSKGFTDTAGRPLWVTNPGYIPDSLQHADAPRSCHCTLDQVRNCPHGAIPMALSPQGAVVDRRLTVVLTDVLYYVTPKQLYDTLHADDGTAIYALVHTFDDSKDSGHRPSYLPVGEAETTWVRQGNEVTETVLQARLSFRHNDLGWLTASKYTFATGSLVWDTRRVFGDTIILCFKRTDQKFNADALPDLDHEGQLETGPTSTTAYARLAAQYDAIVVHGGVLSLYAQHSVSVRVPTLLLAMCIAKFHGPRKEAEYTIVRRWFADKICNDYSSQPRTLQHLALNATWIINLASLLGAHKEIAANNYLRQNSTLMQRVEQSYHVLSPLVERGLRLSVRAFFMAVVFTVYAVITLSTTPTGLWQAPILALGVVALLPMAYAQPSSDTVVGFESLVPIGIGGLLLLIWYLRKSATRADVRHWPFVEDVCFRHAKLKDIRDGVVIKERQAKRKCSPSPRLRVFGPLPASVLYLVVRPCPCNEKVGYRNRVTMPVPACVFTLDTLKSPWRSFFGLAQTQSYLNYGDPSFSLNNYRDLLPLRREDFDVWLSRFPLRRRLMLQAGLDSLHVITTDKKTNVKVELLVYFDPMASIVDSPVTGTSRMEFIADTAPRMIMVSDPKYQCSRPFNSRLHVVV